MTTVNNITGDMIFSKSSSTYRDNYDLIFGNKQCKAEDKPEAKTIVLMDRSIEGEQLKNLTDNLLASLHLLEQDYKDYKYNVFITASKKGNTNE